jgi:LysR family transcriptional regulator for bpeEF and oprC
VSARSAPVLISIVYPNGRNAGAAIKAFVDWIIRIFPQSGVDPDAGSR